MSLGHVLHSVMRPKIPDSLFVPCLEGDRQVVENILMVAQEVAPTLDVTRSSLTKEGKAYVVLVPSSSAGDSVGLNELRDIQGYCPARIQNIHVLYRNDSIHLRISIVDETAPITSTHLDIVRMCKRRRG